MSESDQIIDPITELVRLRAWMLHRAGDIEAIGELPARRRGPEAARIAERIRSAVSATHLVEACKRYADHRTPSITTETVRAAVDAAYDAWWAAYEGGDHWPGWRDLVTAAVVERFGGGNV
jgi:hypothetical protein